MTLAAPAAGCEVPQLSGDYVASAVKLSHTAALILSAIAGGHVYGFSIMEVTGLPSGTVYPALRRLESEGLIRSKWEAQAIADAGLRPARKYHRITASGNAALEASRKRYPLLARLFPEPAEEKR